MRRLANVLAILVLAGLTGAQVPRRAAILGQFANSPPMEGLLIVNRGGARTVVTGLAASSRGADVNAIKLDPIDGRVWIGGIASSGRLHSLFVNGSTVVGLTQYGPLLGSPISGIAFDVNGHPVVSAGTLTPTATNTGVFRIDRHQGTATQLAGGPAGWSDLTGAANCITNDRNGNLYFGVTGGPPGMGGRIYSLAAPGYTTPVLEGWTSPPAGTSTIWSVTWAPDPASARGAIYWSSPPTLGVGPIGKLVLRFLPPGGSILITPSSVPAMNWIEYDQEVGDFWTVSAAAPPDAAYTMTPAGVFTTVALVPPDGNNGTPAAIDVNDCAADQLRVCPAYVPDPAAPFTAEIGACCEPGDTVVLGIVSPVVLVLGTGQAGANGRVRAVFTGIRLPPGTPGALTFLGACIAPGGPVRLTNTVRWPSN